MTTIAYKDGIIAYDSRVTSNGAIIYDDFEKRRERGGVSFFGTGATGDIDELVNIYSAGGVVGECDATALIVQDGQLILIGCSDNKIWKSPILSDRPYAIGSGVDHAYTAMDMGASAYQAVEMAAKRDTGTGGQIRTFTITK